jgi:hypothetical protein
MVGELPSFYDLMRTCRTIVLSLMLFEREHSSSSEVTTYIFAAVILSIFGYPTFFIIGTYNCARKYDFINDVI